MVTRRNSDPAWPGVLAPDQAISVQTALPVFTVNGARSLRMENETGSLAAGKWADFVVLKVNPTRIAREEIAGILPEMTVWKGQIVHAA